MPEAYLAPEDLAELQELTGSNPGAKAQLQFDKNASNSTEANERARIMKEQNIKPGTQEWFRLWFNK